MNLERNLIIEHILPVCPLGLLYMQLIHFIQVKDKIRTVWSVRLRQGFFIRFSGLQYSVFVHCFFFFLISKVIILISFIYYPASRIFFNLSRKENGTQVEILRTSFRLIDYLSVVNIYCLYKTLSPIFRMIFLKLKC